MIDISSLNLAELKAAYDFTKEDLQQLEGEAAKKKIEVTNIPAYNEVKEIQHRLYDELLNRTRCIT